MKRRLPFDGTLIAVVLLLVGFGLVMVFSASAAVSQDRYGSTGSILFRQMFAATLGLLVLFGAMKVDYKIFAKREVTLPLVLMTIGLLLLPVLLSGSRWIHVGPLQFQPSELAKLTAIVFTAYYLARRDTDLTSFSHGVLPSVGIAVVLIVLVLAGRDLGTAACIGLNVGLLLVLAGLRYRHLLILGMGGVSVFGLMVLVEPYRWERVVSFFNPGQDPLGAGYQIRQSIIALGSGGMSGIGLGNSIQKLHFLPEAHTDFIFAVVGEELGLLGCLALITLFGLFMSPDIKVGRSPGRSDQELCDLGRNRLIHGFFWDLPEQYFLASVDGRLTQAPLWLPTGACSAAAKSRRKVFNLWLLLDDRSVVPVR